MILIGEKMKHEYRKHEKKLYCPKNKPELVEVPKQKFFCIKVPTRFFLTKRI